MAAAGNAPHILFGLAQKERAAPGTRKRRFWGARRKSDALGTSASVLVQTCTCFCFSFRAFRFATPCRGGCGWLVGAPTTGGESKGEGRCPPLCVVSRGSGGKSKSPRNFFLDQVRPVFLFKEKWGAHPHGGTPQNHRADGMAQPFPIPMGTHSHRARRRKSPPKAPRNFLAKHRGM